MRRHDRARIQCCSWWGHGGDHHAGSADVCCVVDDARGDGDHDFHGNNDFDGDDDRNLDHTSSIGHDRHVGCVGRRNDDGVGPTHCATRVVLCA